MKSLDSWRLTDNYVNRVEDRILLLDISNVDFSYFPPYMPPELISHAKRIDGKFGEVACSIIYNGMSINQKGFTVNNDHLKPKEKL